MRFITPAFITLITLIVIGALVVAYIGKSLLSRPVAQERVPEIIQVPMAVTDIPAGTLITSDHIVTGRLQADKRVRETILSRNAIVGRYALKDIKQAQPILTSDLYAPRERPPLELKPGMQAVTIGLGDSTAVVDGLIKPGDYVDVHLTINNNADDPRFRGGFTMTMFKGVRLVAMNRLTQPSDVSRGGNTVTFELTREQANILLEARQHGLLTVSYNPDGPGNGGVAIADADRAHFEEILGLPEIPEPPRPFLTEIYRGTMRSTIGYGDDDDRGTYNNWNQGTPFIETPGWVPPRNWGGWGRGGNRGYGGGYRGGYRGTQNDSGQPLDMNTMPPMNQDMVPPAPRFGMNNGPIGATRLGG